MNKRKTVLHVRAPIKGATCVRDDVTEVFFQRQGTSNTFYAHLESGNHGVALAKNVVNEGEYVDVDIHQNNTTIAAARFKSFGMEKIRWLTGDSCENPTFAAMAFVGNRLGLKLSARSEIMAYMFDGYCKDTILSPLVYEPETDTIRSALENWCVVAFKGGKFAEPDLTVDRATRHLLPHVRKALDKGFHNCDFAKGEDYCKRRLAWLAGAYVLEESRGKEVPVGLLTPTMQWPTAHA